jgi:hypothetical protein
LKDMSVLVTVYFWAGSGIKAGMSLFHRLGQGRAVQIGCLSRDSGAGNERSRLKVSAVIRFRPERNEDGTYKGELATSVQQRGWGYVVLVAGELR